VLPVADCTPCGTGSFCAGGVCGGRPPVTTYGFEVPADVSVFTMGGNRPWAANTAQARSGGTSLASGTIGNNQTSSASLSLDLAAAGELRFWVRTDTESCCDDLKIRINGATDPGRWAGTTGWTEVVRPLPAGRVTVDFIYAKDGSVITGADRVWIDDLSVAGLAGASCGPSECGGALFNGTECVVCAPVADGTACSGGIGACEVGACSAGACVGTPVADGTACATGVECQIGTCSAGSCASAPAADCTECGGGASFCAGGVCGGRAGSGWDFETPASVAAFGTVSGPGWVADRSVQRSGAASLVSVSPGDSATSSTLLGFTSPAAGAELRFWVRTSTEDGYDFLRFALNGIDDPSSWAGETGWTEVVRTLPAGPVTLEFRYEKDSNTASGSDAVWVDDITVSDLRGASCGDAPCGDSLFNGSVCVVCAPEPDGALCESDPSDCMVAACRSGACTPEPVADGNSCDPNGADCTDAACSSGRCVETGRPDCARCGVANELTCVGGSCGGERSLASVDFEDPGDVALFSTPGADWGVRSFARDGAASMGTYCDGGTCRMSLAVEPPQAGTVSFWVWYDLESGLFSEDEVVFQIDGVTQRAWTGGSGWTQVSFALAAGPHTLTWEYDPGSYLFVLQDQTFFIDQLELSGYPTCAAGDACTSVAFDGVDCVACDSGACTP
jgi:hypothetical protein